VSYDVVGAEVDYPSFVRAKWSTIGSGRVRSYALQADDGAVERGPSNYAFDTARKEDCAYFFAEDNTYRCFPGVASSASGSFADSACQTPLVGLPVCQSAPQTVIQWGTCASSGVTRTFTLGSRVTGYFGTYTGSDGGSGCIQLATNPQDSIAWYPLGGELPPSAFGELKPIDTGTGRLTHREYLADDGAVVARSFYTDTQQKARCVFMQAADGQPRCLPVSVGGADAVDVPYVKHLYADSSCTTPLNLVAEPKSTSSCAIAAPTYAADWDTSTCDERRHIFSVGAKIAAPVAYDTSGGSCAASSNIDASANDYFAVGAEIDPATFIAATSTTE
jgi:hypothetical protein